ncbi:SusC/RagA family TonB-linked outer membrane protein [Fulvivirga maritima]|uniref:SusC/RagA family TonB-linked outer membrane protein n=1 Tax=Fulvivirga maritima TaxID=2904247 RepID=UPI001F175BA5|nr:SusC/RagA family TonB-linked outer membrane protein [Fulvivirga maritima]UII25395.1 SusC/RagA family TonB-linked outer membrane protein [Fulvivirga maritima]
MKIFFTPRWLEGNTGYYYAFKNTLGHFLRIIKTAFRDKIDYRGLLMRFTCVLILFISALDLGIAHPVEGQKLEEIQVLVEFEDADLKSVFKTLEKKTNLLFAYPTGALDTYRVNMDKQSRSVKEVLDQALANTPYTYKRLENNILVFKKENNEEVKEVASIGAFEEQVRVTGKVTDATTGDPMPGVNIVLKDRALGTMTNAEGMYMIEARPEDVLVFSFIGYKPTEVLVGNNSILDVAMEVSLTTLSEVTILSTGYQKIEKERATGSFSTLESKDLKKVPSRNVIQQLEGQVAGLQVNINENDNTFVYDNLVGKESGGTSYSYKIRGQSTLDTDGKNDSPLIVLDGTPTEIDIRTLNPNDIEKITFLKDAASAAIYGVRAANGVIVIDTKKGKTGETTINFSHTTTFSSKPRISELPLMNSAELIDFEQELVDSGIAMDPTTSFFRPAPISDAMDIMFQEKRGELKPGEAYSALNILRNRNNYGQIEDNFLQRAKAESYNLSLSGGQEKHHYFASASYSKEETKFIGRQGRRLTLLVNQDFKLFDYATLNTSLKGSIFKYDQNHVGLQPLQSSNYMFLPYDQIEDFKYRQFYSAESIELENNGYLPGTYNYIQELDNRNNTVNEQNYFANVSLTIPLILEGLDFVSTYSIERSYSDNENIYNEETYHTREILNTATSVDPSTGNLIYGIPRGSIVQNNNYINTNTTSRFQLNYANNLVEDHYLRGMAGIEFRQMKTEGKGGTLYGYDEDSQTFVGSPISPYTTIDGYPRDLDYFNSRLSQRRRFLSYYGDLSYTYRNKYTLTGSVRLDDYNNFGVDKKYRRQPLWSVGTMWNMKKENFLAAVEPINSLKLRASYGYNGNVSLTTYPFTNISLSTQADPFSKDPYAAINSPANPALRWEKTGIFNIGVDFALFNNRLRGTVEYYDKKSKDLLVELPISVFYGVDGNRVTQNSATLKGHGVDMNLSGTILQKDAFNWDLGGVLTYNVNEVADSRFDDYTNYLRGAGRPPVDGYALNSIFAFRSAGLDNTGRTQVYNRNGDIVDYNTDLEELEDLKYMGTMLPDYYGGINTTLTYKRLSLYVLLTYKLDYVMVKPTFSYGLGRDYDLHTDLSNRWKTAGDEKNTDVPSLMGMTGNSLTRYMLSDKQIMDGDHIRLKQISLTYDLSGMFFTNYIKGASLSFSAQNVALLWTKNDEGLDPDFLPTLGKSSINLGPPVMYSVGVNVNF